MNRDRLTSRGWAWHQGLARYLAIEAEMFKCDDCRSCGEHSGALESARQYALRTIQQPMPHMDRVLGDKLTAMTNSELGNELDRWADSRDRIPKLDSIALRVAASRFRALEEGCDHPLPHIYHDQTMNEDFCQNCGAIVDEDGETVYKWTCEPTPREEYLRRHGVSTPAERPWAKSEAVWHAANQSALPPDLHTERKTAQESKTWRDRIREDAEREGRERASVRGGSRADGPIISASTSRLSVPRIDDSKGGDTRGLTPELLADLGNNLGALATQLEGVADGLDERAADDEECGYDLCDCHRIQGYDDADSGGSWLPKARCALVVRHDEHDWPNFSATGVKRHCDGRGLNRPWMGGS